MSSCISYFERSLVTALNGTYTVLRPLTLRDTECRNVISDVHHMLSGSCSHLYLFKSWDSKSFCVSISHSLDIVRREDHVHVPRPGWLSQAFRSFLIGAQRQKGDFSSKLSPGSLSKPIHKGWGRLTCEAIDPSTALGSRQGVQGKSSPPCVVVSETRGGSRE